MSAQKRTSKALALLIPTGVLGISSALATTQADAETTSPVGAPIAVTVANRLSDIRKAVSLVNASTVENPGAGPDLMLAEWLNVGGGFGWRNGGWHNGGWRNWGNGGWHNGGWGNGGWGNGGWHNGWHNFWHNW